MARYIAVNALHHGFEVSIHIAELDHHVRLGGMPPIISEPRSPRPFKLPTATRCCVNRRAIFSTSYSNPEIILRRNAVPSVPSGRAVSTFITRYASEDGRSRTDVV